MHDLQPLGLMQRRAKSMQNLALEMTKRQGMFPDTYEQLITLPGIGQYMANAILLICHNNPRPLLDSNMARVLERVFGARKLVDIRYDPYLQELAFVVVECQQPQMINWAILDFAALVCTKKLDQPCGIGCPLNRLCLMAQD